MVPPYRCVKKGAVRIGGRGGAPPPTQGTNCRWRVVEDADPYEV